MMNGKKIGRKPLSLILRYYHGICLEGLEENYKKPQSG
jgi:hypothetical protein